MDEYPRLARALLDAGERPASIAAFLTVDYGLDHDQAKAAIVLGRMLDDDNEQQQATTRSSRRVRVLR
jgi:hypothetical protein